MTTMEDINRWIQSGKDLGATHIIVVCDTFNWEDYPVYVYKNIDEIKVKYNKNMQKIMEIITL